MKKEEIIAIRKDNLDRIIEFKTNFNKIYNYEMAKEAINNGTIKNAIIVKGKDQLPHIMKKSEKTIDEFEKMEEF